MEEGSTAPSGRRQRCDEHFARGYDCCRIITPPYLACINLSPCREPTANSRRDYLPSAGGVEEGGGENFNHTSQEARSLSRGAGTGFQSPGGPDRRGTAEAEDEEEEEELRNRQERPKDARVDLVGGRYGFANTSREPPTTERLYLYSIFSGKRDLLNTHG